MKRFIILIIFILIGTGIYFNSMKNGFHGDDGHHIYDNLYIRTLTNIPLFFTQPRTFSIRSHFHNHYRPLVLTSYAINYHIGTLNPPRYHLVNLVFHIGSAFLVFLILQAMLGNTPTLSLPRQGGGFPPTLPSPSTGEGQGGGVTSFIPLMAGLIFLTTPYNSEVVNYITARSTVMCTFFYLMAFYFWVKYREFTPTLTLSPQGGGEKEGIGRGREGVYYYTASFFAFILAMLTKEIAITLPAMLWLYDVYFVRTVSPLTLTLSPPSPYPSPYDSLPGHPLRPEANAMGRPAAMGIPEGIKGRSYLVYTPFIIVGGFIGVVLRMVFFGFFMKGQKRDFLTHFIVEIKVFAKYFYQMAVPFNLSIGHTIQKTTNIYFFLSLLLLISLLVLAYLLWRSRDSVLHLTSFFIVWFFIVLLPTSVVPLVAPYQENRGYLSAIGFVTLSAVGLDRLIKKVTSIENRQAVLGYSLIGLLVVVSSIGVVQRNKVWLNEETLWSDVLRKYPASFDASLFRYTNLGVFYLREGEVKKAEEFLKKALDIDPRSDEANFYMAYILQARGDLYGATKYLYAVLSIRTDDLNLAAKLINLYYRMGKLDEAYHDISVALEGDPDNPAVRRALGLIYMSRGKWEEASREFEIVLKYIPNDPKTIADFRTSQLRAGIKQ